MMIIIQSVTVWDKDSHTYLKKIGSLSKLLLQKVLHCLKRACEPSHMQLLKGPCEPSHFAKEQSEDMLNLPVLD